jgi:predicted transcriptional regulator
MLVVETIARIRREHFIKGKTIKEIARDLKVSRNTVRKVLRSGETSFEYERLVHRAQLEKLMPVPVIAGQARSVETHHKTGVTKADLGNELLETVTIHAASTGFAQILVNHLDALGRPAQTDGAIDKAVL